MMMKASQAVRTVLVGLLLLASAAGARKKKSSASSRRATGRSIGGYDASRCAGDWAPQPADLVIEDDRCDFEVIDLGGGAGESADQLRTALTPQD